MKKFEIVIRDLIKNNETQIPMSLEIQQLFREIQVFVLLARSRQLQDSQGILLEVWI